MQLSMQNSNKDEKHGEQNDYECLDCKDTEFIFYIDEDGYSMGRPCHCRERKAWRRRFGAAMIPPEFIASTFGNYNVTDDMTKKMLDITVAYSELFAIDDLPNAQRNKQMPRFNFGLIAEFGESRIRALPADKRSEFKNRHNNFGIGKTHLQTALAKQLLKAGFGVLVVSDVDFMDELIHSRMAGDGGEAHGRLMDAALGCDVLVWDDIGKARPSEAKESLYYKIINERYRNKKPIVFSTNEDRASLAERIGYAASSRLIGGCGDFILETSGADRRLARND